MIRYATISKFYYRLNVGRSDGGIIPLGAVVVLTDKSGSAVLVLLARSELTEHERAQMDWAALELLKNPLEYLKREVDSALGERVSSDFVGRLARKLTWSIYVSPPVEVAVPGELAADLTQAMRVISITPSKAKDATGVDTIARKSPILQGRVPRALARIAGPEFGETAMYAYLPPAWMVSVPTQQGQP
jgi:hypothetical protein